MTMDYTSNRKSATVKVMGALGRKGPLRVLISISSNTTVTTRSCHRVLELVIRKHADKLSRRPLQVPNSVVCAEFDVRRVAHFMVGMDHDGP